MAPRASRPRPAVATPRRSTRTRETPEREPLVIVGYGRVGGALAQGLSRKGWPVTVFPRSGESLRRAAASGLRIADDVALRQARMAVFAVPDGAVAEVSAKLLDDLGPRTALVHCAGALPLSVFGDAPAVQKRMRGSFHPLVAVSDPGDPLEGHTVALSATGRTLRGLLRRMAEDLGLPSIEVPEEGRAAYHAGAVLAAGGVVSLLSAAVQAFAHAGVRPEDALRALLPLSRSALRGVDARGLAGGLTGPIRRGDVEVVRAHLRALPGDVGTLYRLLSKQGLTLAEDGLSPDLREALRRTLKG